MEDNNRITDTELAQGALVAGSGTLLGSLLSNAKVRSRFKDALDKVHKGTNVTEVSPEGIAKLRTISGVDANIGSLPKNKLTNLFTKDNAFFSPVLSQTALDKLHAPRVPGYDGTVVLGDGAKVPAMIAHELGHGKNSKSGLLAKRLTKTMAGRLAGGLISSHGYLSAPLAIKSYFSATDAAERDKAMKQGLTSLGLVGAGDALGSLVGSVAAVPEEFKASANAIKTLRRAGHSGAKMRDNKKLLRAALNTYKRARIVNPLLSLAIPGILGGGLYLAHKKSNNSK